MRGANYSTYYNLHKLLNGGEVINYKTGMYYGEDLDAIKNKQKQCKVENNNTFIKLIISHLCTTFQSMIK